MSNISNRFFITALDDGTTLHGNLSVDGSLSQAWSPTGNGGSGAAVPNWGTDGSGNTDQPTIMLTLLSGSTYIGTSSSSPNGYISESHWYWNTGHAVNGQPASDTELTFETTTSEITVGDTTIEGYYSNNQSLNHVFFKHEVTVNGVSVPALRIVKNLASSANVDLDTITYKGKYNSGSGILDFSATAQVRISILSQGSYVGVISFDSGISDITYKDQVITMYGTLYDANGNTVSSQTRWLANGVQFAERGTHSNGVTRSEGMVTDNEVIECEFYTEGENNTFTLVYTAYASIDDMQDNEYMYIQYNGANGNAASLRKGQTATFTIWVGRTTDPSADARYIAYQYKLLRGDGTQLQGWTDLTPDSNTHKCTLSISYNTVNTAGKNVTGIIRASTEQFS